MNIRKNLLILSLLLTISQALKGQDTVIGFDSILLNSERFENGMNLETDGFVDGPIRLPNTYDDMFDFWTGWSISAVKDSTTRGFMNQYAAINATGAEGTDQYAVASAFEPVTIHFDHNAQDSQHLRQISVTNATYTYYSLLEGDQFAKRFGGATGNDPDYLKLIFTPYKNGVQEPEVHEFYLADYRFEDNDMDYIIRDWTVLDLSDFGAVDSILVSIESTDNGEFGINTPAYFCMDQMHVSIDPKTSTNNLQSEIVDLQVYPNPTTEKLYIQSDKSDIIHYNLYASQGNILENGKINEYKEINLDLYPIGSYLLECRQNGKKQVFKILKL